MASEMMAALEQLCEERHIDQLDLITRLEQSLAKSYADVLHLPFGARVTIDRATGKVYVYELVPKGEEDPETGEYSEFDEVDVTPADTSRIAAQHAKAEIRAIVRNAARVQIYEEFSQRVGDIITGTVLQSTPDFTIIKIREGVEAELPHFDQRRYPRGAQRAPRRRALQPQPAHPRHHRGRPRPQLDAARRARRAPSARPSWSPAPTPDLLRRLFELEVPEVYDGVVEIRSIAREPGVRSKVAVSSNDDRLDPVGACVGPKGSRVRTVVSELRGERVDVGAVERRPGPLRRLRALPGPRLPRGHRSRDRLRHGDRARRPALPGHRQGGPETLVSPPASRACTSTSRTSRSPRPSCATSRVRPSRRRSSRTARRTAASTSARPASSAATWPVPARASAACTRRWRPPRVSSDPDSLI